MKISIRFAALLLIIAIPWNSYAENTSSNSCAGLVAQELSTLREQILAANQLDQMENRPGARVSNFIEGRAVAIDSSKVIGSHVVSLGSGPDIFLPVYLYPQAKYFHLVDLLTKWGSGPDHVIEEIETRLKSLPFSPTVERTDLASGLSWRVHWQDPQLGFQEKFFYLHEMDFRVTENLEKLAAAFAPQGLGGVVITGIGASLEVRKFFLERLNPGGSMYGEMLYTDKDGVPFDDEDPKTLAALEKDYVITDLGAHEMGFKFTPHRILITKRSQ